LTNVSYGSRTWSVSATSLAGRLYMDPLQTARHYRRLVAGRQARVVGSGGNVGGVQTIRLVLQITYTPAGLAKSVEQLPKAERAAALKTIDAKSGRPTRTVEELWVDPSSYLLVGAFTSVTPTDYFTTRIVFLPRTTANVAKTKLVIPAGFRQKPAGAGPKLSVGSFVGAEVSPPNHCHA
jgi:hypothetical protein